jgi:hypothetical protein
MQTKNNCRSLGYARDDIGNKVTDVILLRRNGADVV